MKPILLALCSWLVGSLGAALLAAACVLSTPALATADDPYPLPDARCRTCGNWCPGKQPECTYLCSGASCPAACECKKQTSLCDCDM